MIQDDIYDLFDPLLAPPIVWADQSAPSDDSAYVALKVSPVQRIGGAVIDAPDVFGIANIYSDVERTLSVTMYGADSVETLSALVGNLRKPSVIDSFLAAGYAFIDVAAPVVDTSSSLDGVKTEISATVDLRIRNKETLTDTVGVIEETNITSTYD